MRLMAFVSDIQRNIYGFCLSTSDVSNGLILHLLERQEFKCLDIEISVRIQHLYKEMRKTRSKTLAARVLKWIPKVT